MTERPCKLGDFKGVGHFERKFQTEGALPPITIGIRKLERLSVCVVSKYPQCIVCFTTKHACDGQTDGRTELWLL